MSVPYAAQSDPSPELVHRVLLKLHDWCEIDRIGLSAPLQADTPLEDALRRTGDDIWEMLEWLTAELDMHVVEFNGLRHFGQESLLSWHEQPFEPLTPRIIASYLYPGPHPSKL